MNAGRSLEHTLNLPNSRFAMRANAVQTEPKLLDACSNALYAGQATTRPVFMLHDGPPYANGEPHLGHALNKVFKGQVSCPCLRCVSSLTAGPVMLVLFSLFC